MNVSFTERLMELNNARERSLISEEEYCMLRLKIFDAFTSSTTQSTTSQPQQQPLSSPHDKSLQQLTPQPSSILQQHVTFSQQTFNSFPAKPLSGKTKIPSAQSIHSSNGSLSSTQQSQQSPRLLSRQINDTISDNITNDSSTPENVIGTNSVSPTNQIYIPKRTRSSLVSPVLQASNINSNEELSVRVLPTLSESQHATTSSANIKSPSSPPSSVMSSSIPILKAIIRDSSKKNLSTNRSTPMTYINLDPTSLFDHTNNHNVTTNIMNHNELNNSDSINIIKNDENHLSNGRITSYDNTNVIRHNGENVNTNSDGNDVNHTSINSGVMNHTSINSGVMIQKDERSEMIQTNVNRMNFMNNMNGNNVDDDDRLVSSLQPFSQSQSSPQPQQRQNINSATLSARQIRSLSLGPKVINSLNRGGDETGEGFRMVEFQNVSNFERFVVDKAYHQYEQSVPEVPPPPYSPPESSLRFHRRRSSTSFFLRPKTSADLRKELLKLTEESKKEQDNWRIEEARLRMRINSKPEEIERVKRKMRESNEKYRKKIEAVTAKLRQLSFNNMDGN
ncbi:13552_t:CDS:2 [Cetraspora pellucida]|uniref:13552_t:CDS:1 n=1 Tax=Cetraspora pellucida TaxID=1433469 RepID=A0A9N9DDH7_9GLOM|nr:13552_t:CDS:2 [Cetraspora pellucida]